MKQSSSQLELKKLVNEKFSDKRLSEKQLNKLQTILGKGESDSIKTPQSRYFLIASAIAVFIVLIVGLLPQQSIDMPQLIANEVVRNHLKLKRVDVEASSYQEIGRYLDKLKFSLISSVIISKSSELMGGRYCSLQGYKAAQLKIKDLQSNKVDTLYQAPYVRDTFGILPNVDNGENPIVVYERGIKVSIWVEKGVLFARTHVGDAK